jgi:hypothetical protein
MIATTPLAGSQFSYDTGTAGTVTVGAGKFVTSLSCYSSAGGTLTITPKGPNQTSTAGSAITIPAGTPFTLPWPACSALGPTTELVFASTDSYVVTYAKSGGGGLVP